MGGILRKGELIELDEQAEADFIARYQSKTLKELKQEIDAKRDQLLYTSVAATFPDDNEKMIQYRNEKDHRALQAVVTAAMALSSTPGAKVKFRTEDNVTNEVPASDFVQIGLEVMAKKEALYQIAWDKKDYLDGLDPEDEGYQETLNNYDVNSGWTE